MLCNFALTPWFIHAHFDLEAWLFKFDIGDNPCLDNDSVV